MTNVHIARITRTRAKLRVMSQRPGMLLGVVILVVFAAAALGAGALQGGGFIEDYAAAHPGSSYAPPFTCATDNAPGQPQYCFILGADKTGRDLFSRAIYGARVSLSVAVVGAGTSLLLGTAYGVVSGYFGGRVDNAMMRLIDFLLGLPGLVVIILLQVFFKALDDYREQVGPFGAAFVELNRRTGGLFFIYVVIGLLSWVGMARLARGQVLAAKQKEYVEAARAVGARHGRVIFVHLLPNIVGPLIVAEMLAVPAYIFTEASLSFLGLGIRPPTPSWGDMLIRAQREGFASRPYLVLAPAVALAVTSLAFNLIGDGLRDWLDPRGGIR